MKPAVLIVPLLLAACATSQTPDPSLRTAQATACTGATATHINRPTADITTTWSGATPDGHAIFALRDGTRLHTCEIDADLTIHAIRHPQE